MQGRTATTRHEAKRKRITKSQGMCQKCPILVARHKLGISELWNWREQGKRPAVKVPSGVRGKSPENVWLFDNYKALELI